MWQSATEPLGGRTDPAAIAKKGRLKWGVGKLIAHSPHRPVVIPIFHTGMEHVTPIDPATRKMKWPFPIPGHHVTVRVGDELNFDDLIEEHENRFGSLWKYNAYAADDSPGDVSYWISSAEEMELYHKITRRIENALIKLSKTDSS